MDAGKARTMRIQDVRSGQCPLSDLVTLFDVGGTGVCPFRYLLHYEGSGACFSCIEKFVCCMEVLKVTRSVINANCLLFRTQ